MYPSIHHKHWYMVDGIIDLFTFPCSRIDLKQGTEEVFNTQHDLESSLMMVGEQWKIPPDCWIWVNGKVQLWIPLILGLFPGLLLFFLACSFFFFFLLLANILCLVRQFKAREPSWERKEEEETVSRHPRVLLFGNPHKCSVFCFSARRIPGQSELQALFLQQCDLCQKATLNNCLSLLIFLSDALAFTSE